MEKSKYKNILIIGGARSGKSRHAQEIAVKSGEPVLFVATATAGDDDMHIRIAEHRKYRPTSWRTLEAPLNLGQEITKHIGDAQIVILDCVTLLVSNIIAEYIDSTGDDVDAEKAEKAVVSEIDELVKCIKTAKAGFYIVTNEVGEGIIPINRMTRVYRDLLGKANQLLAANVDEVYLMVAGIPLKVK